MNDYIIKDCDKNHLQCIITLGKKSLNTNRNGEFDNFYNTLDIDLEKVYKEIDLRIGSNTFFCKGIFLEDELVGLLIAELSVPIFSKNIIAFDHFLYTDTSHSNLRSVIKLIRDYVTWSKENGATECYLRSSFRYNIEGFTKLCKLMKFEHFETGFTRRLR